MFCFQTSRVDHTVYEHSSFLRFVSENWGLPHLTKRDRSTNSLGKAFFESVSDALAGPVVVGADGLIATGNPNQATRALYHLRVRQTFADKKRSTLDAMHRHYFRTDRAVLPARALDADGHAVDDRDRVGQPVRQEHDDREDHRGDARLATGVGRASPVPRRGRPLPRPAGAA